MIKLLSLNINCVAIFCSFSSISISIFKYSLHACTQYSSFGLTSDWYNFSIIRVSLLTNEWLHERTEHLDIFLFSTHHSVVFCFRCSVYWWTESVYFYFYYLRWRMLPFMRQCWGLQVGQMHETAGIGKLINAALLSLMRRVWVYAVLPSSWVNSSVPLVCRHDWVTWEVGCVVLVGRDRGRRGYWVALYLYIYTARLLMSVFL